MLIETLHSLMIAGFLAVWLLVGYVTMRELGRQRKMSDLDAHRFDGTHTPTHLSPHSPSHQADRQSATTTSQRS